MAPPNLLLLARKAVTPWEWCKPKDNIRKLYYSTVPVPGIYAIATDKRHYLVTIRPVKGKKDTEKLFVPATESWNVDEFQQTTCELQRSSATTRKIAPEFTKRSELYSKNSICSREASFKTAPTIIRNRSPSIDSEATYYNFTHPQLTQMIEEEKPIHSVQFIVNGTGGDVPHQQSPFRNNLIGKDNHSLSSLLYLGRKEKCGIQQIDINGFKNLRRPLRIKFCSITKRWMFSTEIEIRTEKIRMCSDITCMRISHENCERRTWRKMFVLDDGYSWVEIGKTGKEKRGALFRVDEKTDCMRRQCSEEMRVSKWYLEREKGKFLECDETADYMVLVRYFQKETVVKEKRIVYREMIEMESAKFEKLEWERVVMEWAKKQMIERRSLEQEMLNGVKVGKGTIQEAKGVEVNVVEVEIEE